MNLEEPTLVSYTDIDSGLVVVLALQEAMRILCLDSNLLDREVVDTNSHTLHVGVIVCRILGL